MRGLFWMSTRIPKTTRVTQSTQWPRSKDLARMSFPQSRKVPSRLSSISSTREMHANRMFRKGGFFRFATGAGVFYCVAHTIARHVGELVVCSGPSMMPTIQDGDLVLAERLSVTSGNIHRGDIVGCLSPHEPEQLLCKRVVAKESDPVNSELLPSKRVPRGHIFLQGDNYVASTDSRHFGPVPAGLVQIRLCLRIWPISRFGWLSNHWFWESEEDVKGHSKDDSPTSKFYPRS